MGRQHFVVGQENLGSREIPSFRDIPFIGMSVERSYAYFCNRCGEVWGKVEHEGAVWATLIHRSCEKHGNGRLSLQFPAGEPLALEEDWPLEALKRELLIELKDAE